MNLNRLLIQLGRRPALLTIVTVMLSTFSAELYNHYAAGPGLSPLDILWFGIAGAGGSLVAAHMTRHHPRSR